MKIIFRLEKFWSEDQRREMHTGQNRGKRGIVANIFIKFYRTFTIYKHKKKKNKQIKLTKNKAK